MNAAAEAAWVGGFIAAEGSFIRADKPRPRFLMAIALGASDRAVCERIRDFLGIGNVRTYPRRKPHFDDETVFRVGTLPELVEVAVPFLDEHLLPSYKRKQYLDWREALLDYWEHRAKRVRPCSEEGCDAPRRAHGLCRHHLYKAGLG